MSELEYKKSYIATRVHKTTVMQHEFEGLCDFDISGGDYSSSISLFNKKYIESRKQIFKDMNWGEWTEESDEGFQNYLEVLDSGEYKLHYYENEFSYRVPSQIKCCDEWLSLGKFTNTCGSCGCDYNGSGQLLAARHHWGEETGEHWSECV
tara:strand:- start:195 stop:647 length:453 start_codon:yes stop_codon:yes gene_type:complete